MSRTQHDPATTAEPTPKSSFSRPSSPLEFDRGAGRQTGTDPSSSQISPQLDSSTSEGYPSWLPKRPPPPAPRSTIHSSSVMGMFNEPGPSSEPFYGGRKPTPRSVRIVSLQNSMAQAERDQHPRRESTDPSRMLAGAQARVWSRATSAGMSPTLLSSAQYPRLVRPRFRSSSLHPELLRNPSWRMRLWFFLFPMFVFLHIPLQTYFDFNAVFILLL